VKKWLRAKGKGQGAMGKGQGAKSTKDKRQKTKVERKKEYQNGQDIMVLSHRVATYR